jgi:hypothetical protein
MNASVSTFRFRAGLIPLLALLLLGASSEARMKKHKVAAMPVDGNYIAGLTAANRFLVAWQNNDQAQAMPLLTNRAKQQSTEEGVDKLFDGGSLRAFEIAHGRPERQGGYVFPVVLLQTDDAGRVRRRFGDISVTNVGKDDWAVDRLP